MARRSWDSLKAGYRKRLVNKGITREIHESGGNLRAARGHAQTPEHPREGYSRPEFQPYYEQRVQDHVQYEAQPGAHSDEIKQYLAQRIYNLHQYDFKFRGAHDPDYPPPDYPPAPDDATIQDLLDNASDEEIDELAMEAAHDTNSPWWILWYH